MNKSRDDKSHDNAARRRCGPAGKARARLGKAHGGNHGRRPSRARAPAPSRIQRPSSSLMGSLMGSRQSSSLIQRQSSSLIQRQSSSHRRSRIQRQPSSPSVARRVAGSSPAPLPPKRLPPARPCCARGREAPCASGRAGGACSRRQRRRKSGAKTARNRNRAKSKPREIPRGRILRAGRAKIGAKIGACSRQRW